MCGDSLDHICKLDFRRKCVSVVDYWLVVGPIPAVDCNAYGRLLMSISLHNVIAAVKLFNWHLLINYNVTKATAVCVCVLLTLDALAAALEGLRVHVDAALALPLVFCEVAENPIGWL